MEIREIRAEETYPLRHKILRPSQALSACIYAGDLEGFHFGAIKNAQLLAVASFAPENKKDFSSLNQYRLRGMATDADWQGRGIGTALLSEAIGVLSRRGISFFWCNARERAIPFYERQGFQTIGDLFVIEDIGPHKVMFREL